MLIWKMCQRLEEEILGRYPPQYGDPNYVYRPRPSVEGRDREWLNRMRERPNMTEWDRNERNVQGYRYLTPLNNLQEGISEKDLSRFPLPSRQRGSEDREISLRPQNEERRISS